MSTNIEAATAKEPATGQSAAVAPTPVQTTTPGPAVQTVTPTPQAVVQATTPAPAPAVQTTTAKLELPAEVGAKLREIDETLARVKSIERAERNKRTIAVLRSMGAVATDATLLMLAGDADPDTVDGRAKLDRLREIEPVAFRQLAPDTATAVASAVIARKPPPTYTGRYDEAYAKRVAEGVIRRANGGE